MQVLFQMDFLVALTALLGTGMFVVFMGERTDDALGDEMALCIRQSTALVASCPPSTYGDLLIDSALGEPGPMTRI